LRARRGGAEIDGAFERFRGDWIVDANAQDSAFARDSHAGEQVRRVGRIHEQRPQFDADHTPHIVARRSHASVDLEVDQRPLCVRRAPRQDHRHRQGRSDHSSPPNRFTERIRRPSG
jgi:hypothetical protein